MPREATVISRMPIGIDELVRLIDIAERPLAVQGIDAGVSAAILSPDGRIACTISAPLRLLSPHELERILPGEELDRELDLWWHAATAPLDDDGTGVALLERLADMVDGRVVVEPRARLDDDARA